VAALISWAPKANANAENQIARLSFAGECVRGIRSSMLALERQLFKFGAKNVRSFLRRPPILPSNHEIENGRQRPTAGWLCAVIYITSSVVS
jgi:hypothetical protein